MRLRALQLRYVMWMHDPPEERTLKMDAPALMLTLAPERARFVSLVRRRVATEADAEDVVQLALLRASTRIGSLCDPSRARAWFYRILRRTIVDHHRSRTADLVQGTGAEREAVDEATEQAPHSPCPCAIRLLDELRPAYAEVLRPIDLEDSDPATVATALGISLGNLHVRLHRARRFLRQAVVDCCGVDTCQPCLNCTCDANTCCAGPRPCNSSQEPA
jgi:RNA polymerase sigma-70 factor (ECF subfamily)